MIDILLGVVIAGLITYGTVETIHHAALFDAWRARLEVERGWFADHVECAHCLSYSVSAWAATVLLPWFWSAEFPIALGAWFCIWLGSRKLAALLNDGLYQHERTHH